MCGIAGILEFGEPREAGSEVERMLGELEHRGPDGAGVWTDGPVALGHRRLAILDLSDGGRQPMHSHDRRWTTVFNGEIFNYVELREELGRSGFQTSCDTEVLLEAVARWGVEKTLDRLNGMFAFALWDGRKRELTLARDRVGEKPLVYATAAGRLVFASELKALAGFCDRRLDPEAVDAYLGLGYVPAPLAIFRDCQKLAAGHVLRVKNGSISVKRWWFPENAARDSDERESTEQGWGTASGCLADSPKIAAGPVAGRQMDFRLARGRVNGVREAEKHTRLSELMGDAVRLRLRSDVPVALWLSGGVDSSVIAAECARLGARLRGFTVAFDGDRTDADYAGRAATRFGIEHEVVEVGADLVAAGIENLLGQYDEPFADSSALPSIALAGALDGRYKVVLTGDGGDEAFGGYRHYERIAWKQTAKALAAAAGMRDGWGASAVGRYVESKALFRADDRTRMLNGNARGVGTGLREVLARDDFLAAARGGALKRALWSDRHLYLANDLMYKADIALAAYGIEGRAPFLDWRVLEWAQGLDSWDLVRGKEKKILLRAAYRGVIPDEILDRPKLGFGAPIARWLAGPLREFARDHASCPLLERVQGEIGAERSWTLAVFASWARRFGASW